MDQNRLASLVTSAFHYAFERNITEAGAAIVEIGTSGDHYDVYAACCGWAQIGKNALTKLYGDRAPDADRGGMWAIQELQPGAMAAEPSRTFAARFLIAYCNDDKDTALALFKAALEAGDVEYVDSVCTLLVDVAGIARLALDAPQPS